MNEPAGPREPNRPGIEEAIREMLRMGDAWAEVVIALSDLTPEDADIALSESNWVEAVQALLRSDANTQREDNRRVAIYRLAEDRLEYKDKAGWFIVVTPDGMEELSEPFETQEEARTWAESKQLIVGPLEEQ
jgi:hypothetical protein